MNKMPITMLNGSLNCPACSGRCTHPAPQQMGLPGMDDVADVAKKTVGVLIVLAFAYGAYKLFTYEQN